MRSQAFKISITVAITAILVGGGVYLWQKQYFNIGMESQTVLLTDNDYHLQLIVTEECKNYLSITREENQDPTDPALRTYRVSASGGFAPWYTYAIYLQSEYDKLIEYGFPRTPYIIARLNATSPSYDALLFTVWRPLAEESGVPENCGLDSIQMKRL